MSQNSARPLSKFNLVLALLWLVDVVVTGVGYWILTSSNAMQADFYTTQSSDYVAYFSAQSGSNLGATLIGVGITGVIVTLAAMLVARSIAKNAARAASAVINDEPVFDLDDDTAFDAAETGSVKTVTAAPAVRADESPVFYTRPGDEPTDEATTAR